MSVTKPQIFTIVKDSIADQNATSITGKQQAPALIPTGRDSAEDASKKPLLIDVVKDFQWTASPRERLIVDEMPNIIFREYMVVGNAILQQAKYMLEFGTSNAMMGMAAGASVGSVLGPAGAAAGAALGGGIGAVRGLMSGGGAFGGGRKGYLEPYQDLYQLKSTGFEYRFPFIEENFRTIQNNWAGPEVSSSTVGKAYKTIKSKTMNLATDAAMLFNEPNAFIEEAKQYQHDREGSPFSIKFALSNTGTYDDVIRNWHLTYLLLYQNMPNRSSKVLIRPPVIYEVAIPGIMYQPLCSMTSVNVQYKGMQRKQKVMMSQLDLPSTGKVAGGGGGKPSITGIQTIVPEAYEINISVTPLVKETQNFLFHTLTKNDSLYDITVRD
jgi:hypothetical protein